MFVAEGEWCRQMPTSKSDEKANGAVFHFSLLKKNFVSGVKNKILFFKAWSKRLILGPSFIEIECTAIRDYEIVQVAEELTTQY